MVTPRPGQTMVIIFSDNGNARQSLRIARVLVSSQQGKIYQLCVCILAFLSLHMIAFALGCLLLNADYQPQPLRTASIAVIVHLSQSRISVSLVHYRHSLALLMTNYHYLNQVALAPGTICDNCGKCDQPHPTGLCRAEGPAGSSRVADANG